ncbi:MAG: cytochrome c oxidase subunit II [Thermoleophilaceae bacterium]|nr:cytochrome c oxidase subunit II [Thermoleophilaceae bacterium]
MPPRVSHPLLRMTIYGLIASAIGIAISLWIDWWPPAAAQEAKDIDTLWDVLLVVSVPVFVLVMGATIYSVRTFKARPGDTGDGEPIHGNTLIEVVWVTIPFIIVSLLAVYGWIVLDDIEAKQPERLQVDVKGQQFVWRYAYDNPAGGKQIESYDLVVPKGRQVEFKIRTDDVIHDFWIPAFRLKIDAVPGLTTEWRATPSRIGSYDVVCAELCGLGHSTMRSRVRVVEPGEFDSWLSEASKPEKAEG